MSITYNALDLHADRRTPRLSRHLHLARRGRRDARRGRR